MPKPNTNELTELTNAILVVAATLRTQAQAASSPIGWIESVELATAIAAVADRK